MDQQKTSTVTEDTDIDQQSSATDLDEMNEQKADVNVQTDTNQQSPPIEGMNELKADVEIEIDQQKATVEVDIEQQKTTTRVGIVFKSIAFLETLLKVCRF